MVIRLLASPLAANDAGTIYFDDVAMYYTVTPVESVTLDESDVTVEIGSDVKVSATVAPADATNGTITWETADESIATVSDGIITAKGIGSTTVTATADGVSAVCNVTVTGKKPIILDSFDVGVGGWDAAEGSINYGGINEVSYDNLNNALQVAVSYGGLSSSEVRIYKNYKEGVDLSSRTYVGYQVTYPEELDGKFASKIYASTGTRNASGAISTSATVATNDTQASQATQATTASTQASQATVATTQSTQAAPATTEAVNNYAGKSIYVDGTKLRLADGNEFIMRGVNYAYCWFPERTLADIKAGGEYGSNTARVCLGLGAREDWSNPDPNTKEEVEAIIKACRQSGQICVLEIHDPTGQDDTNLFDQAVNYWIDMKDLLNANKDYVIVNIANEWRGTWGASGYTDTYKSAIKKLREAGLENCIMVDAPGWGQDGGTLASEAPGILAADPDKNTMFSMHIYAVAGKDDASIRGHIDNLNNAGICGIIGEFGHVHGGTSIPYQTIMDYCQEKGNGYLGWSWYGNGSGDEALDLANKDNTLKEWGNNLFNGTNGIKATAKKPYSATQTIASMVASSLSEVAVTAVANAKAVAKAAASGSIYVNGNTMYDGEGNEFIMKGVNIGHAWHTAHTKQSIEDASALGANTARIVLAEGTNYYGSSGVVGEGTSAAEVENIISWCRANKMICILELHDFTGKNEPTQITQNCVNYWTGIKDLLNANKDYVIVNIANEWLGTSGADTVWKDTYTTAIKAMRAAGIENCIQVDASGWGQEDTYVIRDAASVLEADPMNNVAFSYHMYYVLGGTAAKIKSAIDGALAAGIHISVGEFSYWQNQNGVDERTIVDYCTAKDVGWLAWSWSGNSGNDQPLDLVSATTFSKDDLTDWGKWVFYGKNGIQETSKRAYSGEKAYTGTPYSGVIPDSVEDPVINTNTNIPIGTVMVPPEELAMYDDWVLGNNGDHNDPCTQSSMERITYGTDGALGGYAVTMAGNEQYPTLMRFEDGAMDLSEHKTLNMVVRNNNPDAQQVCLVLKAGRTAEGYPDWKEPGAVSDGTQTAQPYINIAGGMTELISFDLTNTNKITKAELQDVSAIAFRVQPGNVKPTKTIDILSFGYDWSADKFADEIAEMNRPKSAGYFSWQYADTSMACTDDHDSATAQSAKTKLVADADNPENDKLVISFTTKGVSNEKDQAAGIQTETRPGLGIGLDFTKYTTISATLTNKATDDVHCNIVVKNGKGWTWAENSGGVGECVIPAGESVDVVYDLSGKNWKTEEAGWEYAGHLEDLDDVRAICFKVYGGSTERVTGTLEVSNFVVHSDNESITPSTQTTRVTQATQATQATQVTQATQATQTTASQQPVEITTQATDAGTTISADAKLVNKVNNGDGTITAFAYASFGDQAITAKSLTIGFGTDKVCVGAIKVDNIQLCDELPEATEPNKNAGYTSAPITTEPPLSCGVTTEAAGNDTNTTTAAVAGDNTTQGNATGSAGVNTTQGNATGTTETTTTQGDATGSAGATTTQGNVGGTTTVPGTTGTTQAPAGNVAVESVVLDKDSIGLVVGGEITLTATVYPPTATNKSVIWKSGDETVVTVENGVVKALKEGATAIVAITEDGSFNAACSVYVSKKAIVPEGVSFDKDATTLVVGEEEMLKVSIEPANATNQKVSFISSDEQIAKVDEDGKVTAIGAGKATIMVVTGNGKKATIAVEVQEAASASIPVEGIVMSESAVNLAVGGMRGLTYTITPPNATNKEVIWKTNDDNVVKVENGVLTAVGAGTANVYATTVDGSFTAGCLVTVTLSEVAVTGVNFKDTKVMLEEGASQILTYSVLPAEATNQKVTFKPDNLDIVSVDVTGKITAISAGKTMVTITTADGSFTDTIEVEVTAKSSDIEPTQVAVTGVYVRSNKVYVTEGKTARVDAIITPTYATNRQIKYEVIDTNIARVDATGCVTGISVGTTSVKVTTVDGNFTAICEVEVTADGSNADQNQQAGIDNITQQPAGSNTTAQQPAGSSATTQQPAGSNTTAQQPAGSGATTQKTASNGAIALDKDELTLTVKKSRQLVATGSNTTNLVWVSSDSSIAMVDVNGVVKALRPGITTIIVQTQDGKNNAICQVTVKPAKVTGFKKVKLGTQSVKLKWTKQNNVNGYKILIYNTKTKKYKVCKTINSKNTKSVTIKGLKKNTSYKFKVISYVKRNGEVITSASSKVVKAKTLN